jgi:hypothetical protein
MSVISPKRYITFYGRAQFCRPFLLMREFGQGGSERTDLPSPITGIASATMTQTFSHDTLDNPKYRVIATSDHGTNLFGLAFARPPVH